MAYSEPSFTLGIEEEYLLVNKESRDLIRETPEGLMEKCSEALHEQVSPEFLQCQIEVGTRICKTIADARAKLTHLRGTITEITNKYKLTPITTSTHPFTK